MYFRIKISKNNNNLILKKKSLVQVMDTKAGWIEKFEDVDRGVSKIHPTMFADASDDLPLELTMRFLPHHQDTGGFYVAVLEKVADCSSMTFPDYNHRNHKQNMYQVSISAAVPAEILLRSPQKIVVSFIKKNICRIKVSIKYII